MSITTYTVEEAPFRNEDRYILRVTSDDNIPAVSYYLADQNGDNVTLEDLGHSLFVGEVIDSFHVDPLRGNDPGPLFDFFSRGDPSDNPLSSKQAFDRLRGVANGQ